jgi:hypothetical protein
MADITGTWGAANATCASAGNPDNVGHITQYPDDLNNFSITCQWSPPAASGKMQTNTLTGSLTYLPGKREGKIYALALWVLQGSGTVTDENGNVIGEPGYGSGPGHVDGTARAL